MERIFYKKRFGSLAKHKNNLKLILEDFDIYSTLDEDDIIHFFDFY